MSNLFFTADTHFNHYNILRYCARPFETIEEHDQTLIDNINQLVKPNDILWHLGDFCFGRKHEFFETAKKYRSQIKCRNINLVWGNHDNKGIAPLFSSCYDMFELKHEKQLIVMCHYCMLTFRNSCHLTSVHLWGHSHNTLEPPANTLSMDVGVDGHDFKPWSFEEVIETMNMKREALLAKRQETTEKEN